MKAVLTKLFLLTTVVGALACVTSSFAGPMPQEKNVTPIAPVPACDWSGFYIGGNIGILDLNSRVDDVGDFIAAFTGSHRYVVDFLVEEVLLRQPEEVQDFLLQTCLLDRLCGPLCDAVREKDDSRRLLDQVEQTNLFLISLDDERRWYRYHHLFAEVLQSRLQQLQPAVVPELHRRASFWFEQR